MTDVCIRVDAYHQIGYGHLKRCLTLAEELWANDINVTFLVNGDKIAGDLVLSKNFACTPISEVASFKQQAETLVNNVPSSASVVITDIVHGASLKDSVGLEMYLKAISQQFRHVAIDGVGEVSLRHAFTTPACDILVSPYIGEVPASQPVPYRELLGPEYFVLDNIYTSRGDRNIRPDANRVLVTCGGSDPSYVTADVLSALALCSDDRLDVRVVIGPGFSTDYSQRLHEIANLLGHEITFVDAPDNIADEMIWCDLAVSASGLTKYELATTGTPAILMSIDSYHHDVNRIFSDKGSVTDLGIADDVSGETLAETISIMLKDTRTRQQQAAEGQNLVDGKGAHRLAVAIKELTQPQ